MTCVTSVADRGGALTAVRAAVMRANGVDAAFMSFELHERGIHAVSVRGRRAGGAVGGAGGAAGDARARSRAGADRRGHRVKSATSANKDR